MHDLRVAVFRHLQRLSLAFFTRTRTGEVQSRISNDIGGVQNVVTNTATSIASNVTTVARDDGRHAPARAGSSRSSRSRCSRCSCCSRGASATSGGGSRRRRRRRSPTSRAIVQESLSVSRDPARQDDGADERRSPTASRPTPRGSPTSRCSQRMAGRWVMASIQTSFAVMPAAVYWLGGTALSHGTISIGDHRRVHDPADAPVLPGRDRCSASGLDVQTSLALFDRIFEYLDLPGRHRGERRTRAQSRRRGTSCTTASRSATARATGRSRTSPSPSPPARRRRSSARPARGRRRSATSPRACTTSAAGG